MLRHDGPRLLRRRGAGEHEPGQRRRESQEELRHAYFRSASIAICVQIARHSVTIRSLMIR